MWGGVGDWTKTARYWSPHPFQTSLCVVLVLLGCSTGGLGAQPLWDIFSLTHLISNSLGDPEGPFCTVVAFSTTSCHQRVSKLSGVPEAPSAGWWLSLPHLVSDFSDLQLTDFLSSPSYIIVQSLTQSLEWHIWSSSSGNNCHAVHRSLSSGASVYECTVGFFLVPYCQQKPPTRFLLITAIGMWHFLPVHHFGMACLAGSKVNIQHIYTYTRNNFMKTINILTLKIQFCRETLKICYFN